MTTDPKKPPDVLDQAWWYTQWRGQQVTINRQQVDIHETCEWRKAAESRIAALEVMVGELRGAVAELQQRMDAMREWATKQTKGKG
jgi:hypothetical protein